MLKKIVVYGLGTFFGKVIVFLLVPIYTRYLDPADYGQYDVVYSTMQMLVSICYLEIWTGALRFLFDYDSLRGKRCVNKTISVLFLPLTLVFCLGVFASSGWIQIPDLGAALAFGISYAIFNTLNGICRGIGENVLYVFSGLISSLLSCLGGVVLVVGFGLKANVLLYTAAFGYLVAALFVEIRTHIIKDSFSEKIDWHLGKEILLFSLPLLINSIAFSFLNTYDKGLLSNILGTQENGYYAVVSKYTAAISMLGSIYQLAWQEQAFSLSENENRALVYAKNIEGHVRFMGMAMPIAAIFLTLAFPFLAGPEYQSATRLLPLAIWGTYFSAFSGVIGSLFSAEKKTGVILYSTILGAIVNTSVINLCIDKFGTEAINIALLLGFLTMCIMRMLLIRKYIMVQYNWVMLAVLCAEYIVCTLLLWKGIKSGLLILCMVLFIIVWAILNREVIGNVYAKGRRLMKR